MKIRTHSAGEQWLSSDFVLLLLRAGLLGAVVAAMGCAGGNEGNGKSGGGNGGNRTTIGEACSWNTDCQEGYCCNQKCSSSACLKGTQEHCSGDHECETGNCCGSDGLSCGGEAACRATNAYCDQGKCIGSSCSTDVDCAAGTCCNGVCGDILKCKRTTDGASCYFRDMCLSDNCCSVRDSRQMPYPTGSTLSEVGICMSLECIGGPCSSDSECWEGRCCNGSCTSSICPSAGGSGGVGGKGGTVGSVGSTGSGGGAGGTTTSGSSVVCHDRKGCVTYSLTPYTISGLTDCMDVTIKNGCSTSVRVQYGLATCACSANKCQTYGDTTLQPNGSETVMECDRDCPSTPSRIPCAWAADPTDDLSCLGYGIGRNKCP